MSFLFRLLPVPALLLFGSGSGVAAEISEKDYFTELPEVLTVTRLAQPLSETPGAVTIIDRETIRRSGARELVDVLRLVPGYLVGGYNGANPTAAYHAPLDDYGARNLVMIDGRSVYSAYQFGDTHRGMMGVMLEDIERIEVLRGSNSAAYGANALFGVINIVTRHTADTLGAEVSVTGGQGGIEDNRMRIGWGNEQASFRLAAGRRSDSGYGNVYDDKIVSQIHVRGDLRPAADQDLMFSAGVAQLAAGEGFPSQAGNPLRTMRWRNSYAQGVWTKALPDAGELKLMASFDAEVFRDAFPYAVDPSVVISINGEAHRLNLELQHKLVLSPSMRVVLGGGYKSDSAHSKALYGRDDPVSVHEERVFGNLEWRPHPQWVINAGGFAGYHSEKGDYFSPRLMANFHVTPDHTLRAGLTESSRMPTLFELASDVRVYPKDWAALAATGEVNDRIAAAMAFSNLPFRLSHSDGSVAKEQMDSLEMGYLGNFRRFNLTLDVRAYIEKMRDLISVQLGTAPGYVFPNNVLVPLALAGTDVPVQTFGNSQQGFKTRGLEYQLRWKPLQGTEFRVNQAFERTFWDNSFDGAMPPTHATTIAWFQKLFHDLDLSVVHHSTGALTWNSKDDMLPGRRRVDVRLAAPFRVGSTRAEAALVVQAANSSYPEYQSGARFTFERRAFGTLRLEF